MKSASSKTFYKIFGEDSHNHFRQTSNKQAFLNTKTGFALSENYYEKTVTFFSIWELLVHLSESKGRVFGKQEGEDMPNFKKCESHNRVSGKLIMAFSLLLS